jgi:hypothetical protein
MLHFLLCSGLYRGSAGRKEQHSHPNRGGSVREIHSKAGIALRKKAGFSLLINDTKRDL